MNSPNESLTAEEVASLLKVNKNTVYSLAKTGELASYRVGRKLRFTLDDVQAYIKTSTRKAAGHAAGQNGQNGQNGKNTPGLMSNSSKQAMASPSTQTNHTSSEDTGEYVIGGSEMILDIMSNHLSSLGFACRRHHTTMYQSLVEMYYGLVDAAAISLWDGTSNSYNIPFIKHMLPGLPVRVLHVASYSQGFLVKQGNPQGLRTWSDLLLPTIRLANREKGSSARILLDEHMRMIEADARNIQGYSYEVSSGILQATLIAKKEADVGIGSENLYHQVTGLDYLPQHESELVLVLSKQLDNTRINRIIETYLTNRVFVQELSGAVGYQFNRMGDCLYES